MGFEREGIIREITLRAANNAKDNIKTLGDLIETKTIDGRYVSDILSPSELLNAVANYMEINTTENLEGFSDFEKKIQTLVLSNPVFQQILHDNEHGYFEIGLSLLSLGNRLMELEATEEEVVREKLDAGTFTKQNAFELAKANLRGLPDDIVDRIQAIHDGKEETATTKVKVNDKNSMIALVKSGNISIPTLHILLQAKEVTPDELREALDDNAFIELMTDVNDYAVANNKQLIAYAAPKKAESKCHDCASCDKQELCNKVNSGDMNALKEEISKTMTDMAANESHITDDEKILRRAIDKGYVSADDIVQAVSDNRLNPFYIEVKMKKEDPKKYAEVSVGILKRNSPGSLKNLGEDPVETILRKLRG